MKRVMKGDRVRKWALAASLGICAAAPLPAAFADNNRVNSDRLPERARVVLEQEVSDSKEVEFYRVEDGPHKYFMAHYTVPSGLRLEMRVDPDGHVVGRVVTANQPHLDKRDVRRAEAELPVRDAHLHPVEVVRAPVAPPPVVEVPAPAQLPPPPARVDDMARWEDAFHLSLTYKSGDSRRVDPDRIPPAARESLDRQTLGTRDIAYYRFWEGRQPFYSALYTTGAGRRVESVVSDVGKLTEKLELYNPAETQGRDRIGRGQLPFGARESLDRETLGTRDVDYFRVAYNNRTVFAARYTTGAGRRVEAIVSENGKLLDKVELSDPNQARESAERYHNDWWRNDEWRNEKTRPADDVRARMWREDDQYAEQVRSMSFEELPPRVRESVRASVRDVRDFRDADVAMIRRRGGQVVYSLRFFDDAGHRNELRLDDEGRVIDHIEVRRLGDRW